MATTIKPHHLIIGDLHLGHEKVTQFRPFATVEEHDDFIIQRIRDRITHRDYLWILGDVAFRSSALARLSELRCHKAIIQGNHDTFSLMRYLLYVDQIKAMMDFQHKNYPRGIVTHIPVHPDELERWRFNIHAHTHDKKYTDPRYICVSAEQLDYTPIQVGELLRPVIAHLSDC